MFARRAATMTARTSGADKHVIFVSPVVMWSLVSASGSIHSIVSSLT